MTTAPMTADFDQTADAVVIGSSAWLERPVLNLNNIKALASLKINEEICCVTLRMVYSGCRVSEASNRAARIKI